MQISLNFYIYTLVTGYVIMALETVRKLQAQGFETDHITIEVLIRVSGYR